MKKNNLVKAAGIVMVISLFSKVLGFVRDMLIASSFGATYRTDSYTMALTIPNLIFGIVGVAVTTTFIPILSESYKKNGKESMFEFANSVMNILVGISAVLFILGWFFTPDIVHLIAPSFTGVKYNLTVFLTKISVVNILFLSLNSGYTAILQTLDEFTAPALVGIVMNIPILLYIIAGNKYGVEGLMIATIIGDGLQIFIQIPWLIKVKYKVSFKIDFNDERIRRMFILIAPVIIGTGVNQINTMIQNTMASGLADGNITALDYANKLNGLLYFTFASAIVTVIYPLLSRSGTSSDYEEFKSHITTAVNNINLILMPSSILLILLRVPVISLLFKHGAFNDRGVNLTANALLFLLVGMVFWGVRDVFNRAFYAIQDTKTPMKNGILGVILNIIFGIILVKYMGIGGLTLATSISALATCVLLMKDLRKKIGAINGVAILKSSVKMIFASAIMGVTAYFVYYMTSPNLKGTMGLTIGICASSISAMIVYVFMLIILKVKELDFLLNGLKNKIAKN